MLKVVTAHYILNHWTVREFCFCSKLKTELSVSWYQKLWVMLLEFKAGIRLCKAVNCS
jgi:hypothetical protein